MSINEENSDFRNKDQVQKYEKMTLNSSCPQNSIVSTLRAW